MVYRRSGVGLGRSKTLSHAIACPSEQLGAGWPQSLCFANSLVVLVFPQLYNCGLRMCPTDVVWLHHSLHCRIALALAVFQALHWCAFRQRSSAHSACPISKTWMSR